MTEETRQKIISLQSVDRVQGTINDFQCTINNLKHVHWFSIQDILIPMSHYQITSLNATIPFNDGADRTAVLKHGFYTETQFLTEIKTKMDASPSAIVFTVTKDDNTEKITIAGTANFTLQFSKTGTPRNILGYSAVDTPSLSSHTGNNIFNLNRRYHTFNIYSQQLTTHHKSVHSSDKRGGLLLRAINSFSPPKTDFHYTHDNHVNYMIKYDPDEQTKRIDIRITDLDNNPIDFNGDNRIVINLIAYVR
jgi:hypothetical protein